MPLEELTAASRVLIERAVVVAGTAVGLAILATLLVSLLLSRSMARLAIKTRNASATSTFPTGCR